MYPGDTNKSYLEKGLPASLQALRHNDNEICCTVYLDREGQRFGPPLAQSKPISLSNHNEENILLLDKEIREKAEWETLPFVVFDLIAKGRVSIDSEENVYLDGVKLNSSGYRL